MLRFFFKLPVLGCALVRSRVAEPELHGPLNEESERRPYSIVAAFEGAPLEEDR